MFLLQAFAIIMDEDDELYHETELLLSTLDESEIETPISNFTPNLDLSNLRF